MDKLLVRSGSPAVRLAAAIVAIAAALLALTGTGPASGADAGSGSETGWVRAAYLAPGTAGARAVLTSFAHGDSIRLGGAAPDGVTAYTQVPTGLYTVDIRPGAAAAGAPPTVTTTVRVTPYSSITVVVSGTQDDLSAHPVYDDLTPPRPGSAKVRLISAVAGTAVSARVEDGPLLAEDVTTGSATGYADVPAQTWLVDLSTAAGASAAGEKVVVKAGGVYTLLAVQDKAGGVALRAVQDSTGPAVTPRGGVDTGGGWLGRGPGRGRRAVRLSLAASGAGLALAAVAVGVRRRRVRSSG